MPVSRRSRPSGLGAALVVLTLLASGCGGEQPEQADSSTATPSPGTSPETGAVEVPDGVALTEAGTELGFGDAATVAYQVGQDGGSVVRLAVESVATGTVADLSAFQLDEATQASTPYYVQVQVTNAGAADIGGAAVPLFAVDGRDVLVQPSTFTTSFERCPSTPLPEEFAPGAEVSTCLVYLLPEQGTLEAVSYRPLQSQAPITWAGEVQPPAQEDPEGQQDGDPEGQDGEQQDAG